jgi:hypothetical protein
VHLPASHRRVTNGLTAIRPEVSSQANIQGGSNCRRSKITEHGLSAEGVSLAIKTALGQLLLQGGGLVSDRRRLPTAKRSTHLDGRQFLATLIAFAGFRAIFCVALFVFVL